MSLKQPSPPTPLLRRTRLALRAYFSGRKAKFRIPLAPEGTPFQKRVWQVLAAIPHGTLMTYGEIARRLKTSPRAVGNACGANPIALLVPCHRVIAAHGALGGYSAPHGKKIKRFLLRHEKAPGFTS